MNLVLDANALIAFLQNESGGELVQQLIDDENNTCYVHAVNLCEVYYDFYRTDGKQRAQHIVRVLLSLRLSVREDMDPAFWRQAGEYKAILRRVSLADCFCMALANRLDAELVTADHHELDTVQQQNLCRIHFIR